jgi:hypothetical protein
VVECFEGGMERSQMTAPQLIECVRSVLKLQRRTGQTTKNGAVILAMKKIEDKGGPTKFGIGAAAMRMALHHIIGTEVTRQFKAPLSEHAAEYVLPKSAPAEIVAAFGKIPEWIAIDEGGDALWIYALKARPEHWLANARLKDRKAQQTIAKANFSMDIARLLMAHGYSSLGSLFATKA